MIESLREWMFQNALHVQCMTEVIEITRVNNPVALKIKPQYDGLVTAFENEDKAFRYMRKDEYTALKAEKDNERDIICTGLIDAVKAATHHYEPEMVSAAGRLQLVLDNFNKPQAIVRQSYDAETATITNLLQELEKRPDDIQRLGLEGWVEQLRTKNDEFETLARQSIDTQVERPSITMRQARKEVGEVLHRLFNCVNALIIMDGEEAYIHYVPAVNAIIRHYNDVCAKHRGTVHPKGEKKG
jgi:hypothetical protein